MIGCGSFGCDTITETITVTILNANIQYSPSVVFVTNIVSFSSNSSGAVSWNWDFGDGTTSTQEDPAHAYTNEGVYTVTLTITDANGCTYSTSQNIVILVEGIGEAANNVEVSLYPNPFSSEAYIEYTLPLPGSVSIELWNELGQKMTTIVANETQVAGKHNYPVKVAEAGVYMIRFSVGDNVLWKKLVKVQ